MSDAEPVAGDAADPASVWALAGNIVGEHPHGPGGHPTRRGTRLFRPGAKVYLASLRHSWALLARGHDRDERVRVVGQHRRSRQWIACWVRVRHTTAWRAQLVYGPAAVARLREAGWPGFLLARGEFECLPEARGTEAAVRALLRGVEAAEQCRLAAAFRGRASRPWWKFWLWGGP